MDEKRIQFDPHKHICKFAFLRDVDLSIAYRYGYDQTWERHISIYGDLYERVIWYAIVNRWKHEIILAIPYFLSEEELQDVLPLLEHGLFDSYERRKHLYQPCYEWGIDDREMIRFEARSESGLPLLQTETNGDKENPIWPLYYWISAHCSKTLWRTLSEQQRRKEQEFRDFCIAHKKDYVRALKEERAQRRLKEDVRAWLRKQERIKALSGAGR